MKLKTTPAPKNSSEGYLFLQDQETGTKFKVKYLLDKTAGNQPVVKISLSQLGEDGKALVNPLSSEVDLMWSSHTFTEDELTDPAFDLNARVSEMLHLAADRKQRETRERQAVLNVGEMWKPGSLDLNKRLPVNKPA